MPDKAFQSIVEGLQSQLAILNKNGFKVYDNENPEYYISNIGYNRNEDKIFIDFEEDKDNE